MPSPPETSSYETICDIIQFEVGCAIASYLTIVRKKTAARVTLPPGKSGETDRDVIAALRLVDDFQRALGRRDRTEIVDRLRDLIAIRAPMASQWLDLASMAADLGEYSLARSAADVYVESAGGGGAALSKKVDVLAYIGEFAEALALQRTIPPTVPNRFAYALSRGALAVSAGDPGEAREWLEEAISQNPRSGLAWHLMSTLVDFGTDSELAGRLFASEKAMQSVSAQERAYYYYALGKARADLREHARAFAAVTRAAAETRALHPYDRELDRQSAADAVAGYDAGRIAALACTQNEPTDRSIFVMGLPRSGTTLLEQILTSHSEVSHGAEINLLRLLVHDVGGASYDALENYASRTGVPALAQHWDHLLDERFPGSARVVDKTIDTSRKLGLAAAVLPQSPLIWLTRDPLDCAWSCFRHCFMHGIRWSNDLKDMAFNFRLEDGLLSQWRLVLGERLLVVPYEELATEPIAWIRRILAHCGLAEEPQAFLPHENRRQVNTASTMQVRQPINRNAIGSAEPYRAFLTPFVAAYCD